MFLTSRRGLGLRGQDNEAKALVVSALQVNVEALRPSGLSGLDGVRELAPRRLGGVVDQDGCHLLRLLAVLLLPVAV